MNKQKAIFYFFMVVIVPALSSGCQDGNERKKKEKRDLPHPVKTVDDPVKIDFWSISGNDHRAFDIMYGFFTTELVFVSKLSAEKADEVFDHVESLGEYYEFKYFEAEEMIIVYDNRSIDLRDTVKIHSKQSKSASSITGFRLFDVLTEKEFWTVVVSMSEESNVEQHRKVLSELKKWSSEKTEPVVLVGDFGFSYDVGQEKLGEGHEILLEDSGLSFVKPENLMSTKSFDPHDEKVGKVEFIYLVNEIANKHRPKSEISMGFGDFENRPVFLTLSRKSLKAEKKK
jgi:hypothetical protein